MAKSRCWGDRAGLRQRGPAGDAEAAGVAFEAVTPDVDEAAVKARGGTAPDIAQELARLKSLAASREGFLVVGSDQTLELDGQFMSKAASLDELRTNFLRLRGREHSLHSAVAVSRGGEVVWDHVDTARLTVRAFSDAFLDDYLRRHGDEVRFSLGGYWFEGEGVQLFEEIDGDYFTVLGMPLLPLLGFFRREGAIAS